MTTLREPSWLLPLFARGKMAGCLVDERTGRVVESCELLSSLLGRERAAAPPSMLADALGLQLDVLRTAADSPTGPPLTTTRPGLDVVCGRADAQLLVLLVRERALDRASMGSGGDERVRTKLLDAVFELVPHMLFVKSAVDFRYLRLNAASVNIVGCAREHALGKTDYDLFPSEQADVLRAADLRALAKRSPVETRGARITTPGGELVLDTWEVPVFGEDARPLFVLGLAEDVTAQRRLQAERDRANRRAEELETACSARDRFIASLTHDLRNPLAAARSLLELLWRQPARLSESVNIPARVMRTLDRVDTMIADLLDASRIHAGQPLALELQPCDLVALAHEAVDDLGVLYGNRVKLMAHVESLQGHFAADKLRRLIENLVSNGIKYGVPGGVVTVDLDQRGGQARLRVHNHGAPIPADEQEQLFQPFARSRSALESGKAGWGLGLMLVRGIAQAHGGTVGVRSGPGEGTTFTVSLPVRGCASVKRTRAPPPRP